jgi:sulfonate transport system substrate-binding protein
LGYQRTGLWLVAKNRGAFEDALKTDGVTVTWVGPFADAPTGYEALASGSSDFFSSATAPAVSALAGGNPFKIVAANQAAPDGRAIIVFKDSVVKTVADLVGKKVAVQRGNVAEYTLLKTLEHENIAKDQVERVYIAPADAAIALTQKKVDAWTTWDPYISIAEIQNGARIIVSGQYAPDFGVYAARADLIKSQPDAVKKVLAGLQKEALWANANIVKAVNIEGTETKLPQPVIDRIGTRARDYSLSPVDPKILAQMQTISAWLVDNAVIPKPVDVASSVADGLFKG